VPHRPPHDLRTPVLAWFDRQRGRPWFWGLAAAATTGAAVIEATGGDATRRFLGPVSPLVAVAAATATGSIAIEVLSRRGWCPPEDRLDRRAGVRLAAGAAALAGAAIAFDLVVPFDRDMNVAWPTSLVAYPTIAFLAEVGLHLLPLVVVGAVADRLADRRPRPDGRGPSSGVVAAAFTAVALVEAAGQAAAALGGPHPRAALFVGPHLLAIGLVELAAFRRAGFAALATFRVTYYLVWHVVWGGLRIDVLFSS
jgi:hypothetical protein